MSKNVNFKSIDSLSGVSRVIEEAAAALKQKERTISTSAIPEILGAAAGAGIGATVSFGALYALGTVGLSAAGITSGLATAGAIAGGGMVAGIGVLAAPVTILAVCGYGVLKHRKQKQLIQAKESIYRRALQLRDGILNELKSCVHAEKERNEYLNSLNVLLQSAIKDLKADLGAAEAA